MIPMKGAWDPLTGYLGPFFGKKEEERALSEYHVFLFCNKYSSDNPYYCSNVRLHQLTGVVKSLLERPGTRLVRIGGGHRTPMPHNCEAELLVNSIPEDGLAQLMLTLTRGTQVHFETARAGGRGENDDVEPRG